MTMKLVKIVKGKLIAWMN